MDSCRPIFDTFTYIGEDDDLQIIENTFFNLYCYNEYITDCYNTHKTQHYINILLDNGFVLNTSGNECKIDKEANKNMVNEVNRITDELFKSYLLGDEDERNYDKYKFINEAIKYLCLTNQPVEILMQYEQIIVDTYQLTYHDNLMKLLKTIET